MLGRIHLQTVDDLVLLATLAWVETVGFDWKTCVVLELFAAEKLMLGLAVERLMLGLAAERMTLGFAAERMTLGLAAERMTLGLAAETSILGFALIVA